mmetsp:Transcript_12439/g.18671  ORF Transcript_12439/g.18671 Transcript_12439/m.18671 type:complete len:175 (-) Transcript_12439:151-675(-)
MATYGKEGYGQKGVPSQAVQSQFQSVDVNSDNKLSEEELNGFVGEKLGLCDRTDAAMMLIDVDGNGEVSLDEFAAFLRSKDLMSLILKDSKFENLNSVLEFFRYYDSDGSNTLDLEELDRLLQAMTDMSYDSVESVFEAIDTDKSGKISFCEFFEWMNKIQDEARRVLEEGGEV